MMIEQNRHNLFSDLVSRYQSQLYAYIFAVVKNQQDAEDVFQSVCLVLWRKFSSFEPGDNFFSWARQTAKYVLYGFLRHKGRLPTSGKEELLDLFAETISSSPCNTMDSHLAALRQCKESLDSPDEELLRLRYVEALGIDEIAERLQRLPPSICRSLGRVRLRLLECIRAKLASQDHPRRALHEQ